VWEEMLTDWNLDLGKDTIIQAWQGASAVEMAVREGYRVIAGSNDHWVG
jgi:hypothetical protein